MAEIIALAKKDLRLLIRDKAGFFFTFFFPLLMAVFFGTIFSGSGNDDSKMRIIVVDEDSTAGSRRFIDRLRSSTELAVEESRRSEAAELVRLGRRQASIIILKGFGEASAGVFWGESPEVELGIDPSRRAEAGMLEGILMKYGAEGMQDQMRNPAPMRERLALQIDTIAARVEDAEQREVLLGFFRQLDRLLESQQERQEREEGQEGIAPDADTVASDDTSSAGFRGLNPLTVRRSEIRRQMLGPENSYEISFPQGIVWGLVGCAASFGISLVIERTRGTLVRLQIAPIGRVRILAGKALACFITTIGVTATLLLVAGVVFSVKFAGIGLLLMAVLSGSSSFVGIMMLLAVMGKTERAAGGIGWATLLVMSMLGGGMIPLFIMPGWMQTASNVSPVKWAVLALEGAIWRGFTFAEMLLPCGILVGVGILGFFAGVRLFKWS